MTDEPVTPTAADTTNARFARGKKLFDEVGGETSNQVIDALADIAPDFAEHIIAWGFGDIYARPGLPPRDRQLITLGILTALGGCEPQVEVHVNTALNVGLTPNEIVEAFLHAAVYSGFARALNGVFAAKKVFSKRSLLPLVP